MWLSIAFALLAQGPQAAVELPDFSHAGYAARQRPIPAPPVSVDVEDFGAIPDDELDDSAALQAAIDSLSEAGGVVAVGPGRWILGRPIAIRSDGLVLRGAGSQATVLACPRSLSDVRGESPGWSWSGGFVELSPRGRGARVVAHVREPVAEYARSLPLRPVEGVAPPQPGEDLELRWYNDEGRDTLLAHLHGGVQPESMLGAEMRASDAPRVHSWLRVVDLEQGQLEVARPLWLELRPAWRPELVRRPVLREVGVEGLAFEFPETTYPGHLQERGYNALSLNGVIDGWVRDVRTLNADSGILLGSCRSITLEGILLQGRRMHHPISLSRSSECLVQDWRIEAPHRHGTTLSWSAHGNVFSRGYGVDLAMDCHRASPFRNLHTEIEVEVSGRPLNPFRSGGSAPRGTHSARENVYWNVHLACAASEEPWRIGGLEEWPLGVFVGWHGSRPIELLTQARWGHRVLEHGVVPTISNLYEHQLARRRREEAR